ncbi:MAG: DUF1499 domain-containing protein [Planctomycetia bacterium]|nr:DUF1499 domain-containing protein [Planctomycetia bacterium]
MFWEYAAFVVAILVEVALLSLVILSLVSSRRRTTGGVVAGRLAPCTGTPNCVSTQADDAEHFMEPIAFSCAPGEIIAHVASVVGSMPRSTIVFQRDDYLCAEFRSAVFNFVDDVEFYADAATRKLHFRSASRVGRSDFGVNRRRMEIICFELLALDKPRVSDGTTDGATGS